MVAVDPVASLRITGVDLLWARRRYAVGPHSAADWLELILDGLLHRVLPGWIEDDRQARELSGLLLDGGIDDEAIKQLTLDSITVVSGRPYWWTFNLIGVAASTNTSWATLNGRLLQAGVDPHRISLSAWVDALYAVCVTDMDKEQRIQFDTFMETPPAGTAIDEEEEGQAFLALMASS